MRRAAAALVLLGAARVASADPVRQSQDDPHPGIHHEKWLDAALPARIDLVRIDLTSAELALYATPQSDRGRTTSAYAATTGAQVAINGGAFAVAGYVPRGLAMGAGDTWSGTADDATTAVFDLRRAGERTVAEIIPPEVVVTTESLPAGTQGVVSGRPLLVRAGAVETGFDCTDQVAMPCSPAPRSAVALSADGNTLWLAVVDGWQDGSLGMTAAQLAAFLAARGASAAMALDGGSSSTLVLDGAVANHPSDGVERSVANQLTVQFGALPKGQMVGDICKHDVFGCGGDSTRWIGGATVTLDDGRQQTTPGGSSNQPFYDFTGLTPRLACVTVRKAGFLTVHQCENVAPGVITYNSVAMFEGSDAPDAGVGLDAAPTPDAPTGRDAGPADGGSHPATGGGGGGCNAVGQASGGTAAGSAAWLASFVAWFRWRRRGKTDGRRRAPRPR